MFWWCCNYRASFWIPVRLSPQLSSRLASECMFYRPLMQYECMLNWDEVDLLDDGEESFEELNKDLVTVLQLKAYIIRLHPRQILQNINHFTKTSGTCLLMNAWLSMKWLNKRNELVGSMKSSPPEGRSICWTGDSLCPPNPSADEWWTKKFPTHRQIAMSN